MGALTSTLGLNSGNTGSAGMNFTAGAANLINPITPDQLSTAYNQSQTGINNQAAFLAALQAQNGVANQSAVYNQLQNVANGTGPNPATALLNNATGANTANTAALMAGQRGAGANVGLIARQAAQIGAKNQQDAAGQAAALQAQQSLGAIGAAGNIAGNQVANQAAATTGYNQAAQSEQQNLLNATQGFNQAQVGNIAAQNSANASVAGHTADAQGQLIGGAFSGAGAAIGLAKGGQVPKKMADGGMPDMGIPAPSLGVNTNFGPSSFAGKYLYASAPDASKPAPSADENTSAIDSSSSAMTQGGQALGAGMAKGLGALFSSGAGPAALAAAHGGKVPVMVSPDEIYLSPDKAKKVAQGKANPKDIGEKIQGKAKVPGDSTKNDTVKKKLESGGVVVKRSVALDKDDRKAIDFVKAVMAKHSLA